ncbi:MAG TPA: glutamine synthetase, partial [Microbacterium sp.]|nr:glutamine synthetase [Microbacterium sp.]
MDFPGDRRTALVIGSLVDPGGVARAKAVPASHADELTTVGMGASPSWNVCCADDALAFTDRFSVVGDLRLRLDAAATREIDDGITWGPLTVWTQSRTLSPTCTRTALARAAEQLASHGITALIGHELEFVLFPVDSVWGAYGLGPALRNRRFLQAILDRAARAQLEIRQLHAEAAPGQFELSLAPRHPVQAADDLMAA